MIFDIQGEQERAQAEYERTLRLKPDHADAYNNLGILRARRGDLGGPQALRLEPGYAQARARLEGLWSRR